MFLHYAVHPSFKGVYWPYLKISWVWIHSHSFWILDTNVDADGKRISNGTFCVDLPVLSPNGLSRTTLWQNNIAVEHHHFLHVNQFQLVMFHSYVELPEGTSIMLFFDASSGAQDDAMHIPENNPEILLQGWGETSHDPKWEIVTLSPINHPFDTIFPNFQNL